MLGLLVAARDEPGVLYRLSETIFRHGANVTYVAGGAHTDNVAELQRRHGNVLDRARARQALLGQSTGRLLTPTSIDPVAEPT